MDAPWHYHPKSEGDKAKTIDELPVEWFYGDGVVIDMSHKRPGELITSWDLKKALHEIKYEINPFDIVLIMTGADKLWGTEDYWSQFPGLSKESTLWLCEQGVKVMGTDSAGWDRPFWAMVEEFKETGDSSVIWALILRVLKKNTVKSKSSPILTCCLHMDSRSFALQLKS